MDIMALIFLSLSSGILYGIITAIHRYVDFAFITLAVTYFIWMTLFAGHSVVSVGYPYWYYFISIPLFVLGAATGNHAYKDAFEVKRND